MFDIDLQLFGGRGGGSGTGGSTGGGESGPFHKFTDMPSGTHEFSGDGSKTAKWFVDQPGQWVDITPASVKKRQEKGWDELERLLKKGSGKKPAAKKK